MIPKSYIDNYLKIAEGGFKKGEMAIISTGRQTGKSYYMNALKNRILGTNLCEEIVLPMFSQPQSKYKFSRANWYVAEFDDKHYFEVEEWCAKHFGPHPKNPDAWSRWVHKYSEKIHFRDEKDYVLFMLRWS